MDEMMVPKKELTNRGVNAVLGIAGGAAILIFSLALKTLQRIPGIGLALGAVITIIGISGIFSKNKTDKKGGLTTFIVGAVSILFFMKVPIITSIAGTVLTVGAFVSFGLGIWNGIKFLLGLKSRS